MDHIGMRRGIEASANPVNVSLQPNQFAALYT